jgi:modulator of FtsH protease
MTAYDVPEWAEFANTVAGGAAALAGLLFVGLSLNLAEVLKYPGVPARAAATLGLTIAILLTAIFVATPGQGQRVLAAEIGVVGICVAFGALVAGLYQREERSRARTMYVTLLPLVPALMLIVGLAVAPARRRAVLGDRFCSDGFRRRVGQRLGAASRDQTLAGSADSNASIEALTAA